MMIVPTPARGIRRVTWEIDDPAQVNRSEWTGRRKVTILAAKPRWRAQIELTTKRTDIDVNAWRAFLFRLQGVVNGFRLCAVEAPQIAGVTVLVNGGGQAGYSLATDGWGAAGTKLVAGQLVTVGDQLLGLTDDVVANGAGQAVLSFGTYLRVPPADNAPVTVDLPTALMTLPEGKRGWSVDPGRLYGFSFAAEEAF